MKHIFKLFIIGVIVVFVGQTVIALAPTMLTMVTATLELMLKAAWYVLIGYVALRIYREFNKRGKNGKLY